MNASTLQLPYVATQELTPLVILFAVLLGLAVGSFLNALEWRLATGRPIGKLNGKAARSQCVHCGAALSAWELVPVISYVLLCGRCRSCRKPISRQYPVVEMACALLFAFAVWHFGWSLEAAFTAAFSAVLLFIFVYDMKHQFILDVVVVPASIVAFFGGVLLGRDIGSMFIGAAIAGGFFLLQYVVSAGRWIGGGDIRLGVLMGFLLGWPVTMLALFLAYLSGALVSMFLLLYTTANGTTRVAFGTFLSAATLVCLYYGEDIVQGYLNFIL